MSKPKDIRDGKESEKDNKGIKNKERERKEGDN